MVFVDSIIPMHLVGGAHPSEFDAQRMLERAIRVSERLAADGGAEGRKAIDGGATGMPWQAVSARMHVRRGGTLSSHRGGER